MPYTHRGQPVSGNRTDNRRHKNKAMDVLRATLGLPTFGDPYGTYGTRKRVNLTPFK